MGWGSIWDAPAISLVLSPIDDTSSLGSPPRQVLYPLVSPRVTTSRFLAGNREAELKPTTFSILLFFRVFLFFLFSWPRSDIVPMIVACCSYSFVIIYIYIYIYIFFSGWSMRVVGDGQMVRVSRDGDPLPVSFFLFFFCFPFSSSSPMSASR